MARLQQQLHKYVQKLTMLVGTKLSSNISSTLSCDVYMYLSNAVGMSRALSLSQQHEEATAAACRIRMLSCLTAVASSTIVNAFLNSTLATDTTATTAA
eukprot:21404-Heterococcus_DN1.PRE.2